jgi:hypothetical protein
MIQNDLRQSDEQPVVRGGIVQKLVYSEVQSGSLVAIHPAGVDNREWKPGVGWD